MWSIHYFLLLLIPLLKYAHGQTACKDFQSMPGQRPPLNYTAWSLDHIQTWCKDHDPHSTRQCASVKWPSDMHRPERKKLHRNMKEWILKMEPTMGTRSDCIARSAALSVNTRPNQAGLVEAVTCELFDFGKHRRHECVCFPVYDDHVVDEYLGTTYVTTSVFYPPPQIMQSALLAAATNGPPIPHGKSYPKTVKIVQREPRKLGDFPYCPTSTLGATAGLARRMAVATKTTKKHGRRQTLTTTYPALPTTYPRCGNTSYYTTHSASACMLDRCIWDFIKSYTSTVSNWATFSDMDGNPVRLGWNTTAFLVTTKHWGVFPPMSNPTSISKARVTDPWESAMSRSYAAYRTSIGLSLPQNKDKDKKVAKAAAPVCHNETHCWDWCEEGMRKRRSQMFQLIAMGAVISAAALVGMLSTMLFRRRTGDFKWSLFPCCVGRRNSSTEVEETIEVVEIETEDGPVVEVLERPREPERASITGTLRRPAEEGRGRAQVRFTPETNAGMDSNGAADGVRTVSGRQLKFEMSERGSIRSRAPSGQAG